MAPDGRLTTVWLTALSTERDTAFGPQPDLMVQTAVPVAVHLLLDWFGVLKPEVVPECGGLIRRRHEGGSERDRGRMHADGTVRDRRLDNEQTSTSDMHSDTSEY